MITIFPNENLVLKRLDLHAEKSEFVSIIAAEAQIFREAYQISVAKI